MYGPFALDGSAHVVREEYDVRYSSVPDGDGSMWADPYVGGDDYDGDGRSDFAAASGYYRTEDVAVDLFFGGTETGEYTRIVGVSGGFPGRMPDLDGDGLADLWLANEDTDPGWLSGATLRSSDGAHVDDLVEGWYECSHGAENTPDLGYAIWRSVGDWDGDGSPDLVAASPEVNISSDTTSEIFFFTGVLRGEHTYEDASGRMDGGPSCAYPYHCNNALEVADFDGDGILDFATDAYEPDGRGNYLILYPGARGIPTFGTSYDESTLRWYSRGNTISPGDINGDGTPDILGEFVSGEVSALLGWPVPWDDPTWW
jgi:hypothetical protein